jgi:2-dehydro-3-deoxygluconokinase
MTELKGNSSQPAGWDVITLGETMLRLTPPGHKRLVQATNLEIEVGGSESNTAVGLACLGLRVAWLSRLTDNSLGRLIERTLSSYGVDTSQVKWTDRDRVGLYFLEEGKAPRGSSVVYDRANSALSRMQPSELPEEIFQPGKAKLLHLTGITPALGPEAAATAWKALELAKAAGWKISFDLNYRAKLWNPAQAHEGCRRFAAQSDLLIAPLGDARLIFGLDQTRTPQEVLDYLAREFPQASVVLTLGKAGAMGREPGGTTISQPVFEAEEVGRLGGGDAFAAGLIYGYLLSESRPGWLSPALRWGAAVAALKYTIPGDMPVIERSEAEALVAQEGNSASILKR